MGNSPSRSASSSSTGPTIVAEALAPLPPNSHVCCVLGGVNKSEHTLLKTSLGFAGGAGGKFSLKDVKRPGATVLKSDSKSSRKRTITTISTGQGQKLLRIEGTHECIGFRTGCIITPRGIPGEDGDYVIPASGLRVNPYKGSGSSGAISQTSTSVSRSAVLDDSYNPNSDLTFSARALDCTFFEWAIEVRSNLSQNAHNNAGPVSIWIHENIAMGTIDFTWEGKCVARITASPGGSIVWNGEKFDVGKNGIAIVVAPGMDWVLISTMCIMLLCRKADHDAGISTRAGDLSLLSSLLNSSSDRNDSNRSSFSLGGTSGGSREPGKVRPMNSGSEVLKSRSGSGSLASAPRKAHGKRIVGEQD